MEPAQQGVELSYPGQPPRVADDVAPAPLPRPLWTCDGRPVRRTREEACGTPDGGGTRRSAPSRTCRA